MQSTKSFNPCIEFVACFYCKDYALAMIIASELSWADLEYKYIV